MWSGVSRAFLGYMGTGLIGTCYLCALVYLWLTEKRKSVRILFLYMPLSLLALFFNPLFARLVYYTAEDEIYWRVLWLLPMTVTIAYSCVCIYGELNRKRGRRFAEAAGLCMGAVIAVSGSFIYASPSFSRAENIYHVPDAVVEICDAINVPGREVMAVFPLELTQHVRQYSPVTCMPYGREMTMGKWFFLHPLKDEMEREVIDMEALVPLVREYRCHYVIFRPGQKVMGDPEDYGWIRFKEAEGYTIYRDPHEELMIPDME